MDSDLEQLVKRAQAGDRSALEHIVTQIQDKIYGLALRLGRIDSNHLLFARDLDHARRFPAVLAEIRKLEDTQRAVALYRSHPDYSVPSSFIAMIKNLLQTRDAAP